MKTYRFIGIALATAMVCPMLIACGDDDDDAPTAPETPVEVFDGTLVSTISIFDGYRFSYDKFGRCTSVTDNTGDVYGRIDYNNNTIQLDDDEVLNVTFTTEGYISQIYGNYDYTDEDGDSYKGSGRMILTYNSNGNITKIETSSSESYVENNVSGTRDDSETQTFSWSNGNLVESHDKWLSSDSDGNTESGAYTYTLAYDNQINKFNQYSCGVATIVESDIDVFLFPGLLGKGTSNFINKLTVKYDNSGYTYDETVSVTTNANGTIAKEIFQSNNVNYSYINAPAGGRSTAAFNGKMTVRRLFMGKRASRH